MTAEDFNVWIEAAINPISDAQGDGAKTLEQYVPYWTKIFDHSHHKWAIARLRFETGWPRDQGLNRPILFRITVLNARYLLKLDMVIDESYEAHKEQELQRFINFRNTNEYKTAMKNVVDCLDEEWNDMCVHLPLIIVIWTLLIYWLFCWLVWTSTFRNDLKSFIGIFWEGLHF